MDDREKRIIALERARIRAKREKDEMIDDPIVRVRFQNIEDPPTPGKPSPALSFTFNNYIFKESRREDDPDTALRHGQEYDLPLSVVNHLNYLKVPVYGHKKDPATGAIMTVVTGQQNRFSCVPVDMSNFQRVDTPGAVQALKKNKGGRSRKNLEEQPIAQAA